MKEMIKMKAVYTWMVLIALLASCTKENASSTILPPERVSVTAPVRASGPENPANPYDEAGYIHNRALAFIRQETAQLPNPDIEDFRRAMRKFDEYRLGTIHTTPECIDAVKAGRSDQFTSLIAQSPYTQRTKDYATWLFKAIHNVKNIDPAAVRAIIVALESDILSDAELTGAERERLLVCTSIGRYSAYYWTDHPVTVPSKRTLIWWIITVTADIAGGYLGGIDCGIENSSEAGFYAGWI